jgi:hypothetical protein
MPIFDRDSIDLSAVPEPRPAPDERADMLWSTTANRALVGDRRVLLDGRDVTRDCMAFCLCEGRQAVVLLQRPARIDRSGVVPRPARRIVYGRVQLLPSELHAEGQAS